VSTRAFYSWGRIAPVFARAAQALWRDALPAIEGERLAYGLGRSYGDSCLLGGGTMIETRGLDRLISFDPHTGLLVAEAGLSLDALLRFCVPRGWFLPVTPGTRYVTLGGAIANDIHGKNHHRAGTFGRHVKRLTLYRSDGRVLELSPEENPSLFAATIGGLGLIGLISVVVLQLVPIQTAFIDAELIPFTSLPEFMALSAESETGYEHTVSWIDCAAGKQHAGRGIFIRGNHSPGESKERVPHQAPKLSVPVDFPEFCLNRHTVGAFNTLYYHRIGGSRKCVRQHYSPFFHPLDAVNGWSRIYGKRGFYQYQCVVPFDGGLEAMTDMLRRIADSGQASFLAVLKTFGDLPSPGLLSFPRPGITLALDFANRGELTLALFRELDAIVRAAHGAWYPAKDARMSPEDFRASYPALDRFLPHVDPAFTSDFWKRMTA
jgi:FAD/FMN-containing dehydrogenase